MNSSTLQPSHFLECLGGEYLIEGTPLDLDEHHTKPGVNFTEFTRENSKAYVFDYPLELQQILKDTYQDPKKHGYNASTGIQGLREVIANTYSTPMHKVSADEVIITSGMAMNHLYLLYSLCDEGDNFIVPITTYRGIEDFPASLRVSVKKASLDEIHLTKDDNTRFIYVSNPNEPNGKYEFDILAYKKTANESQLPLVINEDLLGLPFEGETSFRPTTNLLGKESAILLNSSDYMMLAPGFRLGFIVFYDPQRVFEHVMEGIEKIAQMFLHPSIPLQFAATEILKSTALQAYLKKTQEYFQEAFVELSKNVGGISAITIHTPEYGYYAALELNHPSNAKFDLVKKLLKEQNVLVLASEMNGKSVFKISLTNKLEDYAELGERLKEFLG